MTTLHLDADGCRATILDYRRRLRLLGAQVRAEGPTPGAREALEALRGALDAEVRARSTLEGQGTMSSVEARLLEPALRQARIALSFPAAADPTRWRVHVDAADACFLVALRGLNGPPTRPGGRSRVPAGRAAPGLAVARNVQSTVPGLAGKPRMASNR